MVSDISIGGMLWPNRFSIGKHPRNHPAPPITSKTAGMMILSVLKIQPVRIAIMNKVSRPKLLL
jgi:hypothetical protein